MSCVAVKNLFILAILTICAASLHAQNPVVSPMTHGGVGMSGDLQPEQDALADALLPEQTSAPSKAESQQPTGSITGTIIDKTGAVSVGTKVRLLRQGVSQDAVTGENGQFSFSRIPPGPFQLQVSAAGFAPQTISGELASEQTYLVPAIVLAVATAETQVQVGGDTVQVAEAQIKEQEKQRVIAIFPNFYASYIPDAAPMNPRQKFKLAWKAATDPTTFVGVGALAGLQQAGDDLHGYGQGAQGYAKRYGAAYANAFAGVFIGDAIMPSLLKQDPRYFYKGTGTIRSRLLYALASPVICKGDNKKWQPNYSGIIGGLAEGGIANLYYPAGDRNSAGVVFSNALIRIGQGALGGIFQEFVLRRLTPHAHQQKSSQP